MKLYQLVVGGLFLIFPLCLLSCTGLRFKVKAGGIIYGRTFDELRNFNEAVLFVPRNYTFVGTDPRGKPEGLTWKSKYAVVGVNGEGIIGFVDGINEAGLTGGLFALGGTQYRTLSVKEFKNSIAAYELITWILTNFSTVSEVKEELSSVKISTAPLRRWNTVEPLHAILHDAEGNSIIIEFIRGELQIHDNPYGVIANDPSFSNQMENVYGLKKKYKNLTPSPSVLQLITQMNLKKERSSSARFYNAAALSHFLPAFKNEQYGVTHMYHALNDLFRFSWTRWISIADTQNKRYHLFTGSERTKRSFDLLSMNLNAEELLVISIGDLGGQGPLSYSVTEKYIPMMAMGLASAAVIVALYNCLHQVGN